MLRIPAWRAELRDATDPEFLEVCEAYEVAWCGIMTANSEAREYTDEYREIADWARNRGVKSGPFYPQPACDMTPVNLLATNQGLRRRTQPDHLTRSMM